MQNSPSIGLILFLCLSVGAIVAFGFYQIANTPDEVDSMTVQQVIEKRYKSCVRFSSFPNECDSIAKLPLIAE